MKPSHLLIAGLMLRYASPETLGDFNLHTAGRILLVFAALCYAVAFAVYSDAQKKAVANSGK